jgi:hypothetical protein
MNINLLDSLNRQKARFSVASKLLLAAALMLIAAVIAIHGRGALVESTGLLDQYVRNDFSTPYELIWPHHKPVASLSRGGELSSTTLNPDSEHSGVGQVLGATTTTPLPIQTQSSATSNEATVSDDHIRSVIASFLSESSIQALFRGASGPQGSKGEQGPPGPMAPYQPVYNPPPSVPGPIPSVFVPGGIVQPNPTTNFSGMTLFAATDLSSQRFNTGTATVSDTLTAQNINVTGTITGNVSGSINPGFTAGSVVFQGASGLAQDNSNFFWDSSNHRLGIGDITPAASLTVGSGDLFQVNSAGAIAAATGITSSGAINFSALATNGPLYTTSGNGTLNSEAQLAISRGGTNSTATPTAGAVAYATGSAYGFTAAGTANQILTSGGAGMPIFQNISSLLTAGNQVNFSGTTNVTINVSSTPSFASVNGLTITNNGANTLNIAAGKTLAVNNTLSFAGTDGTSFTLPTATDTLVGRSSTDTLTNKSISGSSNSFSNIPNAGLTNSALTINTSGPLTGGGSVALGSSLTLACATCVQTGGNLFTAAGGSGANSTIVQGGTLTLAQGSNITTANNGSGTVTIATINNPTFSTSVTTPIIKPSADSTTAFQLQTSSGSNVLDVDTTNSRVGIGTTNPLNKLGVAGNAVIGSGYAGTNTAPTDGLLVQGNVGIGTTNPSGALHVKGANFSSAIIDAPVQSNLNFASNGTVYGYVGAGQVAGGGNTDLGLRSTGILQFAAGSTTSQLTINGSAITTPAQWTFSGTGSPIHIDSTTGTGIGFNISGTQFATLGSAANSLIGGTSTDLALQTSSGGNIQFATNGTALSNIRMTIASNGNVGIGTTSPVAALTVGTGASLLSGGGRSVSSSGVVVKAIDPGGSSYAMGLTSSGNGGGLIIQAGVNSNQHSLLIQDVTGAATYLDVQGSGQIGVGGSNTDSTTALEIKGTANSIPVVINQTLLNNQYIGLGFQGHLAGNAIKTALAYQRTGSFGVGDLVFLLNSTGDTSAVSLTDEKFRITSGGNVGIGTTTPTSKLHVVGTGTFGAAGVSALNLSAHTATLTVSPTTFRAAEIGAMTLSASSAQTVTTASSLYVNTPVAGSNVTITNNKPIDTATGAYLSSGGTWTNTSSRERKENFVALDPQEVLDKIDSLSVERWNYKAEDPSITHIGPVAEEFHAAFNTGGTEGDKSISTIDPAGVALLGVQGLSAKVKTLLDFSWVIEGFKKYGVIIEQDGIKIKSLAVEKLQIGSADKPSGFVLYDKATKEPYCVAIENGEFTKSKGDCSDTSATTVPQTPAQGSTAQTAPETNQDSSRAQETSSQAPAPSESQVTSGAAQ